MARVLTLVALLAGCGADDTAPEWRLDGYRVLAVVADKPEASPDDVVTVRVVDHDTEGRVAEYRWRLCLYSVGTLARFECADPALEQTLDAAGPEVAVDFGPGGLDLRARYDAIGPIIGLDGEPITFERGLDVVFKVEAGPPGGRTVRVAKRVRLRDGDGLNRNPTALPLLVAGEPGPTTAAASDEIELEVPLGDDTPERYVDPASGDERDERLVIQFYATAGTLGDRAFLDDPEPTVSWRAPAEPGPVQLYAVVRDSRGGLAVSTATVEVGR